LHTISTNAQNILLLSATPVQQRQEEYLSLLRLLQPAKYDEYALAEFEKLVEKQGKIIQKTALVLDDLEDFEEEISDLLDEEEDPHESEDCEELYEEIYEKLEEICDIIDDKKLSALLDNVNFGAEDLSVYSIKVIISYICSNYQIENCVIRNKSHTPPYFLLKLKTLPKRTSLHLHLNATPTTLSYATLKR
jgi:ATP-dependent helicase HepA